ncbi:MAG: class I SAM-dependent methyltransferase [Bacteroidota bacterium]|nr:class I SAM-dependent methyltransferase [Bacteroidota bacterium]
MYSAFQLARKYFNYYFTSQNGKGHGVHSPFVFDFIIHVLNDKKKYECYPKIELLRKKLLKNNTTIEVEDFGAGSALIPFKNRKIKDIAGSSLKNKKYAQLLFRIAKYYQSKNIIELGTSLGISTCYLASAHNDSKVTTLEGSHNIAKIALSNFKKAGLNNIRLIEGNFEETLFSVIDITQNIDFLFIDGNHRKKATLEYFDIFLKRSNAQSIFIFDDIHWSREMEEAWKLIQQNDSVTLTIDLFFVGIVFFRPDFKVKQHFTIRF